MIKNAISRVAVLLWRLVARIVPRNAHTIVGWFFGRLFLLLPVRHRAVARKNIAHCFPDFSEQQTDDMIVRHAAVLGMAFFDTAIAWFWSDKRIKKVVDYQINGSDTLESKDGRGTLLLCKHTLHFLLDARLISLHHKFYGIIRSLKSSAYINSKYRRYLLQTSVDYALPNQPIKLIRWLKKGHIVYYAMDQDYGLDQSIIINLFNQPAATITAPYRLHKMTGCRICTADSYYDDNGKLIIDIKELTSLDATCQQSFLHALNDEISAQISRKPQGYHWYYKRFKSVGLYENK